MPVISLWNGLSTHWNPSSSIVLSCPAATLSLDSRSREMLVLNQSDFLDEQKKKKHGRKRIKHYLRYINQTYTVPTPLSYLLASFGGHQHVRSSIWGHLKVYAPQLKNPPFVDANPKKNGQFPAFCFLSCPEVVYSHALVVEYVYDQMICVCSL